MTAVADTTILVDHLRGNRAARTLLAEARERGELVAASVLTKVEILAGTQSREAARTRELLDELEWVAVDDAIAERAGELAQTFARSNTGIDAVDFVVAATAEALGARVWTRNVRHFPMLDGLEAPY